VDIVAKAAPGRPSLQSEQSEPRRFFWFSFVLFLVHAALMLIRYGRLPIIPMLGDEVIVNDAALSLGTGHGYAATSFAGSPYGIDRLFAHFPPLYPLAVALATRLFGVSAYSLRLTTTVMSIAASAVFLYVLMRLCRSGLVSWSAAYLAGAIYCTFTPLIILERAARMESMIELLALLSFAAILHATETTGQSRRWWLVAAGLFAGLSAAAHPEAVSVMVLLGILELAIVPGEAVAKVVSFLAAAVTPVAVWLLTFGRQSGAALQQFREILHHATPVDPGLGAWARHALETTYISGINQNLFLLAILVLVLALPVAYLLVARKLPESSLGRRMGWCFAVVGLIELANMEWGLRTDFRRYMFLFGLLLIGVCVSGVGHRPLARWQRVLGSLLVVAQLGAAVVYLAPRANRLGRMDPERFMPIVDSVPAGASILTSPSLWLDFRARGIPITLRYEDFDAHGKWADEAGGPFERFDVIIMNEGDAPWGSVPEDEAMRHRTKRVYDIGGDVVDVYQRNPVQKSR